MEAGEPEAPAAAAEAVAMPQEDNSAALEHAVVCEEGEHTKYPPALATHQEVLEDKELFLQLCEDLCTKLQDAEPRQYRPTKFRVPTAAGQDLDLQRLYRLTTELGGAEAVTEQNRWTDVIKPMQFPSKVNTAAIRKIYSQLLWHFEQVYFHCADGAPLAEPPEQALANAAAAASQAAAAEKGAVSPAANGRGRSARSRKGYSLAAILAAEDQLSSGWEDPEAAGFGVGDDFGASDATAAAAAAGGDDAAAGASAKKPAAAAAAPASGASPGSTAGATAGAAAAAANGPPAAAAAETKPPRPRSRPSQPRGGSVLVPGKTPELTAFHKVGRHRRDLTGATVTGKVEARFDCGYFVSITVGGMQFGGVLYCPAGTGTAAPGAGGQQGSRAAAANVKREDSAAAGSDAAAAAGGGGSSRKGGPAAAAAAGGGSSIKREAGAAGLEGGDYAGGSSSSRSAKRRRSNKDANDPALAGKPKSAKTAFNFFASEQWASMRDELGSNAAPQDISRQIGERWSKATDDERAPFIALAQEDKVRFDREMDSWRREQQEAAAAAAAAAEAADAAAAAAGDAAAGGDSMDLDAAAGGAAALLAPVVKQEHRPDSPVRPHHPKIKLKMSAGTGRPTPPPAAAGAGAEDAEEAAAAAAAARSPELPGEGEQLLMDQQQQQLGGFGQGPDALAAAAGGPEAVPGAAAVADEGEEEDGDGMLVDGAAEAAAGGVYAGHAAGL